MHISVYSMSLSLFVYIMSLSLSGDLLLPMYISTRKTCNRGERLARQIQPEVFGLTSIRPSPQLKMSRYIVVGGGLAGLSAAHTILQAGQPVTLLERNLFMVTV